MAASQILLRPSRLHLETSQVRHGAESTEHPVRRARLCPTARVGLIKLLGALAFILALGTPTAHGQTHCPIEEAMRELQVRYHYFHPTAYEVWAACYCDSGDAPHYPRDGYYDCSIEAHPEMLIGLAGEVVDAFNDVLTAPSDGWLREPLEGHSYDAVIPYYSPPTFPTITAENWCEVVNMVLAETKKLKYIYVTGDFTDLDAMGAGTGGILYSELAPPDLCDDERAAVAALYGADYPATDWDNWQPPSSGSPGISVGFGATTDSTFGFKVALDANFLRGKPRVNLTGLPGSATIYLVTWKHSGCETYPGNPTAADRCFHAISSASGGGVVTGDLIGDFSDSFLNAFSPIACEVGTFCYEWQTYGAFAMVEPEFTHDPDEDKCGDPELSQDPKTKPVAPPQDGKKKRKGTCPKPGKGGGNGGGSSDGPGNAPGAPPEPPSPGEDEPKACTMQYPPADCNPVSLTDGRKLESEVDISVSLVGTSFNIVRAYASNTDLNSPGLVGENWTLSPFRFLSEEVISAATVLFLPSADGNGLVSYRQTGTGSGIWKTTGTSNEQFDSTTLTVDVGSGSTSYNVWRLTEPGQWTVYFYRSGGSTPSGLVGLILGEEDVYGNRHLYTYKIYGTSSPKPRLDRIYLNGGPASSTPAAAEVWFRWNLSGDSSLAASKGRLRSIAVMRRNADGALVPTDEVDYTYKEGTSNDLGSAGDLIQVDSYQRVDVCPEGATPYRHLVTQYRYHHGESAGSDDDERLNTAGSPHQLKMVINPEQIEYYAQKRNARTGTWSSTLAISYASAELLGMADSGAPSTSDWTVGETPPKVVDLAAKIISYSGSPSKVSLQYLQTSCGCSGSPQGVKNDYTYYYPSGADGPSTRVREYQLVPGTGYSLYRTDYYDMKRWSDTGVDYLVTHAVLEAASSARLWAWHYTYNSTSRDLETVVLPSARSGSYTPADTSTVPSYSANTTTGLVKKYVYNSDHRLTEVQVGNGSSPSGGFILVQRWTYRTDSGKTHLVDTLERFTSDSDTTTASKIETTQFEYGFHSGSVVAWIGILSEPEAESENGPSTPATHDYESYELFDTRGLSHWTAAEDRALTYRDFDLSTGVVTQLVRNSNTTGLSSSYVGLSTTGWGRFGDGGSLTTTWTHDLQGRTTSRTSPGPVTHYTVREISASNERADLAYYTEVALPHKLASGTPAFDGAANRVWMDATGKSIASYTYGLSTSGTYDPLTFPSSISDILTDTLAKSTVQHTLSGLVASSREWPIASDTAAYETDYVYDPLGRLDSVKSPTDTITRNSEYDVFDRVLSVKIGTDASGTSSDNMQLVAEYFYDYTGSSSPQQDMGDGYVTVERRSTGEPSSGSGGLSDATRVTTRTYDFRGRLQRVKRPDVPHEYIVYDNLDRVIARGLFTSEPTAIDDSSRTLYTETAYSQRGLPFVQRVAIDPAPSVPEGFLETHTWPDAVGRAIETWGPNAPATKMVYDGLGRATVSYATDRGSDAAPGASDNYADAGSLAGDRVLEQTEYTYSGAGMLVATATRRRLHDLDETSTGALTGSTSVTTYTATIYDAANRPSALIDYGTNTAADEFDSGGAAPTIPTSLSGLPSYAIVSQQAYDARGRLESSTDPMGTVTKYVYDDLDRRVAVIENYDVDSHDASVLWSSGAWSVSGVGGPSSGTGDYTSIDRVTLSEYDGVGHVVKQTAYTTTGHQSTAYLYNYHDTHASSTTAGDGSSPDHSLLVSNDILYEVHYPNTGGTGTGDPGTAGQFIVKYGYNRLGELRSTTDQNGTRHVYKRDVLGRVTEDHADTFGVSSPIDQTIQYITASYDSAGRLYEVKSKDGSSTIMNAVRFTYTKLWQVENLYQDPDSDLTIGSGNTGLVAYGYDIASVGSGNYSRVSTMTYPDGVTTHAWSYDSSISRVNYISAGWGFMSYSYLGLGMVATAQNGVGVRLDRTLYHNGDNASLHGGAWGYYPGFDRHGRIARQTWADESIATNGSSSDVPNIPPVVEIAYSYDQNSNRTSAVDARPGAKQAGKDWEYHYDALDRLTEARRGILSSGSVPAGLGSQKWALDMLGNWNKLYTNKNADTDYADAGEEETRTHNAANQIAHRFPAAGTTPDLPFAFDDAGNLKQEDTSTSAGLRYTHDAWNRLVKVEQTGAGGTGTATTLQANRYNGVHWRTIGTDTVKIDSPVTTTRYMYYSAAWQLLQEDIDDDPVGDPGVNRRTQIVWGIRYIDDAVLIQTDPDLSGSYSFDQAFNYLTDAQFSTVCLLDIVGRVAERVGYTPYGVARHHWFDDVDGDGASDSTDMGIINTLAAAGSGSGTPITGANYNVDADLTRDGVIDASDQYAFSGGHPALPDGFISDPAVGGYSGNPFGAAGPDNPVGYDAYIFNTSTQQCTVRFRHYAPAMGRWIEQDPAGYISGPNMYAYGEDDAVLRVDPTGLADTELHHFIGQWLANYTEYGARSQGLRICLTTQFHTAIDRAKDGVLTQIRLAFQAGTLNQWQAYNRALLAQLRMLPSMMRDSRTAAGASGGSMLVWSGGLRALLAQLGYLSYGQAAAGAAGVGTVAIGGTIVTYLIYDINTTNLENDLLQFDVETRNRLIAASLKMATQYADRILNDVMSGITCCGSSAADDCKATFIRTLRTSQHSLSLLTWAGRIRSTAVRDAWQGKALANALSDLADCLTKAGCKVNCGNSK